jgi:hypothetical protein
LQPTLGVPAAGVFTEDIQSTLLKYLVPSGGTRQNVFRISLRRVRRIWAMSFGERMRGHISCRHKRNPPAERTAGVRVGPSVYLTGEGIISQDSISLACKLHFVLVGRGVPPGSNLLIAEAICLESMRFHEANM